MKIGVYPRPEQLTALADGPADAPVVMGRVDGQWLIATTTASSL